MVFYRYPLIIDPSGQATEFIMNEYKDRKITRTSFLDDAFRKNLESALRFGNPLLVQVYLHTFLTRISESVMHSRCPARCSAIQCFFFLCVSQDVESYDPILNPVLNREVRRTGGRVLITLGDQDIDLSPSFVIFLSTRDPTVRSRTLLLHTSDWVMTLIKIELWCALAGGIPSRPLLTCDLCQLHRDP